MEENTTITPSLNNRNGRSLLNTNVSSHPHSSFLFFLSTSFFPSSFFHHHFTRASSSFSSHSIISSNENQFFLPPHLEIIQFLPFIPPSSEALEAARKQMQPQSQGDQSVPREGKDDIQIFKELLSSIVSFFYFLLSPFSFLLSPFSVLCSLFLVHRSSFVHHSPSAPICFFSFSSSLLTPSVLILSRNYRE
jgi:hypothetical protein